LLERPLSNPSSQDLPAISDAKRKLIEKLLRGEIQQQAPSRLKISPRLPDAIPQLSFAQERIWFLDQLNPDSAVFNVPLAVRIPGAVDYSALEESINELVRRHEVLRTTFVTVDGRPRLIIQPSLNIDLAVVDLTNDPKPDRESHARALLRKEEHRPFDLARGPLIRTTLLRLDEQDHFFQVNMHHIVSDGWSLVLFFNELSAVYESFTRAAESPLNENAIQYADYAAWQRDWLQGAELQKQLSYWTGQLGGPLPVLDLPVDRPRPAVQTFNGAREWLELSEQLTSSLIALAQNEGATLFMTLLAAFKVLLYRYTGQEDVIVGSPIANRRQTETESLIGFFLNNLALRSNLSGNPDFREVLARVKRTALDAYANQDVPFERLIEALKPERDLSRTPIFQVYFNLFNFAADIHLPGSDETISFVEAWSHSDEDLSKFDLTLYAGLQGKELKLALVYNTDLFDQSSVAQLLEHFRTLLADIVAHPNKRISDLTLRTHPLAATASPLRPTNTFTEFRRAEIEQSIADRFAGQVAKYPRRLAVKSRNCAWTYAELDSAANQIAQRLVDSRGNKEERVALLFEPDAPMIAAMIGALKAGKTYVPLDPNDPQERLAQIIEDSEAITFLTNSRNLALANDLIWSVGAERSDDTALDEPKEGKAPSPLRSSGALEIDLINIDDQNSIGSAIDLPKIEPDRLAYILYTSGSTGKPKGVMQNHRNVLHYIRVYTNNLHLNANDRLTLLSSYCFDASVMDIYGALLNGATLCTIDIKEEGLAGLSQRLIDEEITVYHSTPTVYRYFVNTVAETSAGDVNHENHRLKSVPLRLVVLGGERVTRTDVELYRLNFSDDCLFVNGFGPTEATVALQNFIDKKTKISGDNIPVGFPVEDTEVVLLNQAGDPSEISGEIAIKSKHVALGYWHNAGATAKAFVDPTSLSPTLTDGPGGSSPTVSEGSLRIYKTGDMGRRLPDGNIQFEGRKDFQVKIRGFRVELGEIESTLIKHRGVREGVVIANESHDGEQRLIAYVVPQAGISLNGELRDFLRQKLPEYMVPSSFVMLDSLPLTASGKLNRRALPAPFDSDRADVILAAPVTPLQKSLAAIWADVLEVKAIGINDNFFGLGGHSLLAVRLFAQIEKKLGQRLPLVTLFQAPTVAQLAAILQKKTAPSWSSLVAINSVAQSTRLPFFCVHAVGGNVLEYYDLARRLGTDQPFYGLQSRGLDGRQAPHTRIEDMAAHYIKEIRELQPSGPYFIGGRSLGGIIAFETAYQLRAQGQEVGLLALLDSYPVGYSKLAHNAGALKTKAGRIARRVRSHISNLAGLPLREKVLYVIDKAQYGPIKIKRQAWQTIYHAYERFGRALPRALRDVQEFNWLAARDYVPHVYDGKVTLFWASRDLRASFDLVTGWRVLAEGGMEVHEIPGTHLDIIKEPNVSELAAKLRSCLDQAMQ